MLSLIDKSGKVVNSSDLQSVLPWSFESSVPCKKIIKQKILVSVCGSLNLTLL